MLRHGLFCNLAETAQQTDDAVRLVLSEVGLSCFRSRMAFAICGCCMILHPDASLHKCYNPAHVRSPQQQECVELILFTSRAFLTDCTESASQVSTASLRIRIWYGCVGLTISSGRKACSMKTFLLISKYNISKWLFICIAGFDTIVYECVCTAAFSGSLALRRVQRFNIGGKGALG